MGRFANSVNDPVKEGHPTTETRLRHWQDVVLRKFGFAVHSRPKRGQATWIRNGEVYGQEEAIQIARREKPPKKEEAKDDVMKDEPEF
jgi:hypothetical protein